MEYRRVNNVKNRVVRLYRAMKKIYKGNIMGE